MEECDLCYARKQLKTALNAVEAIPDFDIELFDFPILRAYLALDEAHHALLHYCDYDKDERSQDAAGG
jgi:hypothetical protein